MVICGLALVEVNLVLTRKLFMIKTILVLPSRSATPEGRQGAGPLMVKTILVLPSRPALLEQGQGAGPLMAKMTLMPATRPALLIRGQGTELLTVKTIMTLAQEPTVIREILMLNLGLSLILFQEGSIHYSLRKVQVVGHYDFLRALVLMVLLQLTIFMN